jgi:hypothetical protein
MYLAVAAALAIVGVPGRANADPIVLTGGIIAESSGNDLPGFTVTGSDSFFTGVLGISGTVCCGFSPGDVVTLNAFFPIVALPFQTSTQIVDGTPYANTLLRRSPAASERRAGAGDRRRVPRPNPEPGARF